MSKHTPGTWNIGANPPNGEQTIGTRQGLMVAVATTGAGVPTEANARLIAAAPELLDALTQCRAELLLMIDKHNKQDADDGSWLYDYQTVVEADAAIAKATGGNQ